MGINLDVKVEIGNEICDCSENLQINLPILAPENPSLKGIWRDAGFEKIIDLEDAIDRLRQELQDSILQKAL